MKKIYRTTATQESCYDWWKEGELDFLKDSDVYKYILCIDNYTNKYINIFDSILETRGVYKIKGIKAHIDANGEFELDDWEQETDKRNESIEEWIKEHTLEIYARGYSHGEYEYDSYKIIVTDKRKMKEVEKALSFIKEIFTISEIRVTLESREIETIDGKEFTTDWEEVDSVSTLEEFPEIENITIDLLKYFGINIKDLETEATEAVFID